MSAFKQNGMPSGATRGTQMINFTFNFLIISSCSVQTSTATNPKNENLTVQSVSPAETDKHELYKLASRFKQGQSRWGNMDVLLLFESVHYHITTKNLQVKAITAWPLYVQNWRNANLTCYYSPAKISPSNTPGNSLSFTLSLGVELQQGCAGDGNAGWTDPLHLRNIGKSYAWPFINDLCLFQCCWGETEQIGYVVQKEDAIEHNGTKREVIKASRAKGEWV